MHSKTKELFQKHHQDQAAAHTRMAECMTKCSAVHTALGKAAPDQIVATHHRDAAEHFKAAGEAHADSAESHLAAFHAIGELPTTPETVSSHEGSHKSAASDRETMLENIILKLAGGNTGIPAGLSLIPRYGAPRPGGESDPVKKVDPSLRHLVADDSESKPTEIALNAAQ
jgi:hypothetical protein